MPSNSPSQKKIALFLFAHQDDEVAVYSVITRSLREEMRPIFLYFTSGNFQGQDGEVRCAETIAALHEFGVDRSQIYFIGNAQNVSDGELHLHLDLALSEALRIVHSLQAEVVALYCPAWEGGHQDHDAVNLLTRILARKLALQDAAWQAPFYHGQGLPGILFKVLSPLVDNGPVRKLPIPVGDRLRYVQLCSMYKSQAKSWLGLLPFIVIDYLIDGTQKLQPVSGQERLWKPHPGPMLYERRNFCKYDEFERCAREFLNSHW